MLAVALIPLLAILGVTASPITKRYSGVQIVSGRDGKCLAAQPKTGVGSVVNTVDCSSFWATLWDINPGSGSVLLHNGNLALDAGNDPSNNGFLKVWTSYPGLYQQTWYLTDDNRIAITGGNQCLDEGDNGAQTYQCITGNGNQVWNIRETGNSTPPPSSTTSVTPPPSCTCPTS